MRCSVQSFVQRTCFQHTLGYRPEWLILPLNQVINFPSGSVYLTVERLSSKWGHLSNKGTFSFPRTVLSCNVTSEIRTPLLTRTLSFVQLVSGVYTEVPLYNQKERVFEVSFPFFRPSRQVSRLAQPTPRLRKPRPSSHVPEYGDVPVQHWLRAGWSCQQWMSGQRLLVKLSSYLWT